MKPDTKSVFISLLNALQAGKIYSQDHPIFKEFSDALHKKLTERLADGKDIVLGIIEGELAWEDEVYFDLSQRLKSLIDFLQECGINRMVFRPGLTPEELARFIGFLTAPGRKRVLESQEGDKLQGIENIRVGKLRARAATVKSEDPEGDLRRRYEGSLGFAADSLKVVLDKEEIDFLDLRFNMLNILENFMGRHQDLLNLVSVKEKDLVTFAHLLHVAVLAMFFASRLGFARDDVLDLGIAALFHDIGKLQISSKVLKKTGKLAADELVAMKDHPVMGAMILQAYQEVLGMLPAVVAFEHHLRYDGLGYPKAAYPRPPHVASLIVSICDVYDALAEKRSYKSDFPPDKIHETMRADRGTFFDPTLLDRFFQVVGVWPVGTIVVLSDDRIAVVREANEQDIFRPKVEVVHPDPGGEMIDLLEVKDRLGIRETLNPLRKGQPYIGRALARPEDGLKTP